MNEHDSKAGLALDSALRGARWLLALLEPDGSLRTARNLTAYYKTPFGLVVAGHVSEAERMLDYVAATYMTPDGDLDGSGVPWYQQFRIYPHAWLTCAAMARGRFEMARELTGVLERHFDPATGGFFATREGASKREGPQEIMTTSMAGLACLWAGRHDIARETGRWLRNLLEAQPDLTRGLYQVWDSRSGLVTEFPAEQASGFLVDATKLRQWYFQYGISAAFLSSLGAATGEIAWILLAQKFLHSCRHCREDRFLTPQAGKIGWGAAWTYRMTRESRDRELAHAVIDGLRAIQGQDGSWNVAGVYSAEPAEDSEPLLDVTSEFVALQGSMGLVHGI